MSQIFILESFPVVAMYVPFLETLNEVTGAEGCASIFTTGVEPMFGVHIVTSPVECPKHIIPFVKFYLMQPGGPLFVLASEIVTPVDTSKYLS